MIRYSPLVLCRSAVYVCLLTSAAMFAVAQTPVATCTVADIRGNPIQGTFCGGSTGSATCTAGSIYTCSAGPAGTTNNCKLSQVCANGCILGGNPFSSCYTGAKPLTISSLSPVGGSEITLTSQVSVPHASAIINLIITSGDLIPGRFCAVPPLANNQTSATFNLSTAAVTKPTPVPVFTDVAFNDVTGMRELISPLQTVTLQPGGTDPPPPPLESFTLTPSTVGPSGLSEVNVTLTHIAPASGVTVALSSSDPATAFPVAGAAPQIGGSCLTGGGAFSIMSQSTIPAQKSVTISATSGAPGEVPLTQPLTVIPGCVRNACSGGSSCGLQPDGCGGTEDCGCTNLPGQTCGGGGVANVCGPAVFVATGLTLNPATVTAGQSSVGTITFSEPAPANTVVTFGSTNTVAIVPASITVPAGQSTANFTITTGPVPAGPTTSTISATSGQAVWQLLTINPTAACSPTSCAAFGKTCGTISDGCGGVLTCGICSGTQTCGGGGIPNVCGSGSSTGTGTSSTGTLTVSATGGGGDISSSPAGFTKLQSGKSASAVFNLGTSITLKTSDGHGAVWSGECSSGGKPATSCTFTFNATGAVAASNQ